MSDEISAAIEAGELDRALELLEVLIEEKPDDLGAQMDRAALLISLDRATQARPLLEGLLQQAPDELDVVFNLGIACMEMEDWEAAAPPLRQALGLAPESDRGDVYHHLALVLMELDQLEECDTVLANWEAASGPDPDRLNIAGEVAMFRGAPEEAETLWRKALDLDPEHQAAQSNLSLL